jgi:hypothetical protein
MSDNVEVKSGEGEGLGAAPEPKEFTEIERRASEQGWRPQDEWDGEPDDWRTAREFLDRGEFFKKIDEQNRTIKELRKTQTDLTKHLDTVRKTEFKRALDTLKAQKKAALADGDVEKAVEIDDEIIEVRQAQLVESQQAARATPQLDPELNPIFVSWKQRNPWYEQNTAMRAYADRLGGQMNGMSPNDILSEVEKAVKKEFAHKFENPARKQAAAVEGGGNKGPSKREPELRLTEDERRAMQRFVRQGIITEEQYIKDLKEAKSRGL